MINPVAVLISDIHYSLANLELADSALRQAIAKANKLGVQVWICGDLHDTKANMRGECLNALVATLMLANKRPRILIGNHDLINERSKEHSLTVLDGAYAEIIDKPCKSANGTYFIPYHSDPVELCSYIKTIPKNSTLVMHQGITGSNMGDYVLDKSAIAPLDVSGHRVISGHYHARQTINLPDGGVWDYIGNPYTVSYGEANDPEKGFQILMDDGSLEFVPTSLRKHGISDIHIDSADIFLGDMIKSHFSGNDLLWLKIRGSKERLAGLNKARVSDLLGLDFDYRLDLVPDESIATAPKAILSNSDTMDALIESLTNVSDDCKARLKDKWKSYA